jgi:hypothetical protein
MMIALAMMLASVECSPIESCVRAVEEGDRVEAGYWLSAPYLASITARLEGEDARLRAEVTRVVEESEARCLAARERERIELRELARELDRQSAWYRSPTVLMAIAGTMLVAATGVVVIMADED